MDSSKVLCFFCYGDHWAVGAFSVAWAGCLVGAVSLYSHPGKRWRWPSVGTQYWNTGSMPHSGVALLYNGVIVGLVGEQLARVDLVLLGLKHWFLGLVRLWRQLVRHVGFLGQVSGFLGLALFLSQFGNFFKLSAERIPTSSGVESNTFCALELFIHAGNVDYTLGRSKYKYWNHKLGGGTSAHKVHKFVDGTRAHKVHQWCWLVAKQSSRRRCYQAAIDCCLSISSLWTVNESPAPVQSCYRKQFS